MENHIARRANEALVAMCGCGSLTKRLRDAQFHFDSAWKLIATAPEPVRQSIAAFLKCKTGRGSAKSATLAADAIYFALVEYGRQDALQSSRLKQNRKGGS
jgi:hypothetical protein